MTCTGRTYAVNPGAPDEGTDVHHARPCPVHPAAELIGPHPDAERAAVAARAKARNQAAREARIADRDGVIR